MTEIKNVELKGIVIAYTSIEDLIEQLEKLKTNTAVGENTEIELYKIYG